MALEGHLLVKEGANGVTYTASDVKALCICDGTKWCMERSRDMSRNQEREAFKECAVLMNVFKANQTWSPRIRQSTKTPDFKCQKEGDFSVQNAQYIKIHFWRLKNSEIRVKKERQEEKKRWVEKEQRGVSGLALLFQFCWAFLLLVKASCRNCSSLGSKKLS